MVVLTDKDNEFYLRYIFRSVLLCVVLFLVLSKVLFSYGKTGIKTKTIPKLKINDIELFVLAIRLILKRGHEINDMKAMWFQSFCALAHLFRKEGICYLVSIVKPVIVLYKAETVEPILSSNRNLRKGVEYHFVKRIFKDGILDSPLKEWRPVRKLLAPAFNFRKLDEFVFPLNEKATSLNEKIMMTMKSNHLVDIESLLRICTLEIACEILMGFQGQEDNILAFDHLMKKFRESASERVGRPLYWLDIIYYRLKKGKYIDRCVRSAKEFTKNVMVLEKKRQKISQIKKLINSENLHEKDSNKVGTEAVSTDKKIVRILDILIDQHFQDETFNMEFITRHVDAFMIAGSDTVATNVAFAVYVLGLHPDKQRKVHEELDQVFRDDMDRPITREDVKKLKYLKCVIKETQRLFPPVPIIGRTLDEDTIIDGYTVSKGTICLINIYMLHRDPVVFPNPEVFDPERFRNPTKRHPYAFVPFSAGPRNCIGQNLGVLETTILMASILRCFKVQSNVHLDKILLNDELVLCSENGLLMSFVSRSKLQI